MGSGSRWEQCMRGGSPPWLIFAFSVSIMGIGILALAYTIHPFSNNEGNRKRTSFCYGNVENERLVPIGEHNVSIPVSISAQTDVMAQFKQSGASWLRGEIFSAELDLQAVGRNAERWEFLLSVDLEERKRNGKEIQWESCMILFSNTSGSLPQIMDKNGCGNTSDAISGKFVALSRKVATCPDAKRLTLGLSLSHKLFLIPLVHDTFGARMHLLYTSYFIFLTLFLIGGWALCRGHNQHHKSVIASKA